MVRSRIVIVVVVFVVVVIPRGAGAAETCSDRGVDVVVAAPARPNPADSAATTAASAALNFAASIFRRLSIGGANGRRGAIVGRDGVKILGLDESQTLTNEAVIAAAGTAADAIKIGGQAADLSLDGVLEAVRDVLNSEGRVSSSSVSTFVIVFLVSENAVDASSAAAAALRSAGVFVFPVAVESPSVTIDSLVTLSGQASRVFKIASSSGLSRSLVFLTDKVEQYGLGVGLECQWPVSGVPTLTLTLTASLVRCESPNLVLDYCSDQALLPDSNSSGAFVSPELELSECGLIQDQTSEFSVYVIPAALTITGAVDDQVEGSAFAEETVRLNFRCLVADRTSSDSSNDSSPIDLDQNPPVVTAYDSIDFQTTMATPIQAFPQQRIYLEVSLNAFANLDIFILDCYSTTDKTGASILSTLIENGCKNTNVELYSATSTNKKLFSLQPFVSATDGPNTAFLYLKVVVCNPFDSFSRCNAGCQPSTAGSRKKRAANFLTSTTVALGPFQRISAPQLECESLLRPTNGFVDCPDGQREGAVCSWRCTQGYSINGTQFSTCLKSGDKFSWSPNSFTECVDIDECDAGTAQCTRPNSVCKNTIGWYECPCRPGTRENNSSECVDYSKWNMSIRMTNLEFSPALNDNTSTTYLALKEKVEKETPISINGIKTITSVKKFSRGSVIADLDVLVNKGVIAENNEGAQTLQKKYEEAFAAANGTALGIGLAPGNIAVLDSNECLNAADNDCHANAECVNTVGSFTCRCRPEYKDASTNASLPGRTCIASESRSNDTVSSTVAPDSETNSEFVAVLVVLSILVLLTLGLCIVFCVYAAKKRRKRNMMYQTAETQTGPPSRASSTDELPIINSPKLFDDSKKPSAWQKRKAGWKLRLFTLCRSLSRDDEKGPPSSEITTQTAAEDGDDNAFVGAESPQLSSKGGDDDAGAPKRSRPPSVAPFGGNRIYPSTSECDCPDCRRRKEGRRDSESTVRPIPRLPPADHCAQCDQLRHKRICECPICQAARGRRRVAGDGFSILRHEEEDCRCRVCRRKKRLALEKRKAASDTEVEATDITYPSDAAAADPAVKKRVGKRSAKFRRKVFPPRRVKPSTSSYESDANSRIPELRTEIASEDAATGEWFGRRLKTEAPSTSGATNFLGADEEAKRNLKVSLLPVESFSAPETIGARERKRETRGEEDEAREERDSRKKEGKGSDSKDPERRVVFSNDEPETRESLAGPTGDSDRIGETELLLDESSFSSLRRRSESEC